MVVLSILSKTNTGGIYMLCFFAALLMTPKRRYSIVSYAAGGLFMTAVMALVMGEPMLFLEQTVFQYGAKQEARLVFLMFWPLWVRNYYWMVVALAFPAFLLHPRKQAFHFTLLFGLSIVALFSLITGSLRETQHFPVIGCCIAIAYVMFYRAREFVRFRAEKRFYQVLTVLLTLVSIMLSTISIKAGALREFGAGSGMNERGTYAMKAAPFRGWKTIGWKGEAVDQIVEYIIQNIPKDQSLLILNDLQIVYGLAGRDSFPGVPFLWHIGHLPATVEQLKQVHSNILLNPPDWILTSVHAGYPMLNELIEHLRLPPEFLKTYVPVKRWETGYILLGRIKQ